MAERLIDNIYEASAAVELWPQVLADIAEIGGGVGASFVSGGRWPTRWAATPNIDALIRDYGRQPHENPRIAWALGGTHEPRFQTDLDIMTREQMDADPFFTEFMRPRGFGWCLGTTIRAPGADPIIIAVERAHTAGPPDALVAARLDALRPHLARAMLWSARLGLERARAKTDALAMVGYPAAILDSQGRAVAMNNLFEALIPAVAQDLRQGLALIDQRANKLMREAVLKFRLKASAAGVQSFPLEGGQTFRAAAAHLLPICGGANDIYGSYLALLLLTPLEPGEGPGHQILEALFDLTPAEARVARGIAEARTVEAIAQTLGLSRETVRSQLKAVFAKTGTDRQAELVRLLAALPRLGL